MTRPGRAGDEADASPPGDESFARTLATFKRDGCLLLVTGDVGHAVRARASRKLLGAATEDRARVLAVVDTGVDDPVSHLPGVLTATSDGVTVLDLRGDADLGRVSPGDVADHIDDALPDRPRPAGGGAVRFSLATLDPWLGAADTIPSLLEALCKAAHRTDAIGAVHLPRPADHQVVGALTPHADASIELRSRNDALPEQRWYLPDTDTATNWVTM